MKAFVSLDSFINSNVYIDIDENLDNLFLVSVNEIIPFFNVKKLRKRLNYYKGHSSQLLIVNSWFKKYDNEFKKFKIDVVYIDLWLKYTYEKLFVDKLSPVRTEFLYNKNNSFLFLMGKSYRMNRIRLFYKLLKNNCIKENTFYTLRYNAHDPSFEETFKYMNDILNTRDDLRLFLNNHTKEIDVAYDTSIHDAQLHYTGIPYNVDIFLNSNFQIIPESDIDSTWITEKTWISIANKMPFILVGSAYACSYLESLGFKTFRKYMKHSTYDEYDDYNTILENVVKNVRHWEKHLHKFEDSLRKDVEHNFKVFEERYCNYLITEDYICKKYGVDKNFLNNDVLNGYPNHYPVKLIS
jgi:hypothetical protein